MQAADALMKVFGMRRIQPGDRVRKSGSSECGTVISAWTWDRDRALVIWDHSSKWLVSVRASDLILVSKEPVGVPEEARPISIGAMAGGRTR